MTTTRSIHLGPTGLKITKYALVGDNLTQTELHCIGVMEDNGDISPLVWDPGFQSFISARELEEDHSTFIEALAPGDQPSNPESIKADLEYAAHRRKERATALLREGKSPACVAKTLRVAEWKVERLKQELQGEIIPVRAGEIQ